MADARVNLGLIYGSFEVYDDSNVAVTGLVQGNFTVLVSKDGAVDSTAVTITEIGNGRYGYSFTPGSAGEWMVLVTNATYNPRGWSEDLAVVATGGGGGGGLPIEHYHSTWDGLAERNARLWREHADRQRTADEEALVLIAAIEAVEDFD